MLRRWTEKKVSITKDEYGKFIAIRLFHGRFNIYLDSPKPIVMGSSRKCKEHKGRMSLTVSIM